MNQWLVRTSRNWIFGPLTQEEVCQSIQEGKLDLQDEICLMNSYWIYLHENEEIKKYLGIEIPKQTIIQPQKNNNEVFYSSEDNEITDPDITQVLTLKTQSQSKAQVQPKSQVPGSSVLSTTKPQDDSEKVHLKKVIIWSIILLLAFLLFLFIDLSHLPT